MKSGSNPKDETLINLNDFNSIEIQIQMKNESTQTAVGNDGRIYGSKTVKKKEGEDLSIRFIEIFEEGLVLEIPSNSCAEGHILNLTINTLRAKPVDIVVEVLGKVTEVEKLENNKDTIRVELTKYGRSRWRAFKQTFSGRQKEIEDFFAAVRGY
jgi:hypothetical protein